LQKIIAGHFKQNKTPPYSAYNLEMLKKPKMWKTLD